MKESKAWTCNNSIVWCARYLSLTTLGLGSAFIYGSPLAWRRPHSATTLMPS